MAAQWQTDARSAQVTESLQETPIIRVGHTALCDTALSLSHYFVCFIAAVCVCQCLPCLFHRCLLSCLSLHAVGVTLVWPHRCISVTRG